MNKLFTHVDLDGIGCAVLAKLVFGDKVDIEFCQYNDIDEKVMEYINSETYKFNCFITDISVSEEVANKIDEINSVVDYEAQKRIFTLLDHHKTAEFLNKYDWATVIDLNQSLNIEGYKESGTSLFYDYLVNNNLLKRTAILNQFVNLVRMYDTWEWKQYQDTEVGQMAKDTNDILYIVGRDEFIETYTNWISTGMSEFRLDELHFKLLKYKRQEIELYLDKKMKQVEVIRDKNGYRVAVVTAELNLSELGTKILDTIECDYVAMFTGVNYSLRSKGIFDVSAIAKEYGGGGHKNASGFGIDAIEVHKKML